MALLIFDHLVVAATTLDEGTTWIETILGAPLAPGGQHPFMATQNRLLSLGPSEYLEIIAIDPSAVPPDHARWFGLDGFSGPPRLTAWVARCDDLDAAVAELPGSGPIHALSRGSLRWHMAVPENGQLPLNGAAPALIRWDRSEHPAARLPDRGCRLTGLQIAHPDPVRIESALAPLIDDPRLSIVQDDRCALRAVVTTPDGTRMLE